MGGLEKNQESEGFCPERLLCSPLLAQSPSLPCASPAGMESSSEQLLLPDGLCSLGVRRERRGGGGCWEREAGRRQSVTVTCSCALLSTG